MFEISVPNPDDLFGMPIYEGECEFAYQRLVPGDYAATWYDYESDSLGNPYETIVRVTATESEFVCINCGEMVHECECAQCISAIPE